MEMSQMTSNRQQYQYALVKYAIIFKLKCYTNIVDNSHIFKQFDFDYLTNLLNCSWVATMQLFATHNWCCDGDFGKCTWSQLSYCIKKF